MVSSVAAARAALVVVAAAVGLIGCSDYVDRKETIAFSAGNAVQTNIVTHVVDPWPASARNRNFATSGQRMQRAVENYRCGRVSVGGGGAAGEESAPPQAHAQGAC